MATETKTDTESREETTDINASLRYGSTLMTLSFAGLGVFGIVLAVRILRGQGVVESGVDIGMTTAELAAFNPALPHYIAHVRMAAAGMFVALGILGLAVTWYGVRRGERWAWTATVSAFVVGTLIGLPMHYSGAFHVEQLQHLGPPYAILTLFVVGAAVASLGLGKSTEP
jgi:hypothetical protein